MIISTKHKFICFNPQKTGTAYRELLFNDHADISISKGNLDKKFRHINCVELENILNFLRIKECRLDNYFKFTFSRNPWQRYASWFNMECVQNGTSAIESKKEFLNNLRRYSESSRQEQYCIFRYNSLDYIGECEYQSNELMVLQKKLGINLEYEKLSFENYIKNSGCKITRFSHSYDWRELYTDESIELVYNAEKYIIDLKKYTFD